MLAIQVTLLRIAMIVSLAVAVFLFIRLLFPEEEQAEAKKKLGVGGVRTQTPSLILRVCRPLFVLLTPLTQNIKAEKYRTFIRRGFISAGMTDELTPDEFFAWKIVLGLFFPVFVSQMLPFFEMQWWKILAIAVFGFFYPDLWLRSQIQARHKKILRQMPYVMDLLTLSVEAGLDFVSGIAKVVEKAKPGPLI